MFKGHLVLQARLMIEILNDNIAGIESMISEGAKVNSDALHILFDLSLKDGSYINLKTIEGLLKHGVDIKKHDDYSLSLLDKALALGNQGAADLISQYIGEKCPVNVIGDGDHPAY